MKAVTVTHTRGMWRGGVEGGGGRHAREAATGSVITFVFACTDTSNGLAILVRKQQLTHDFMQTVLPLVCHLFCLLSFRFALSVTGSVRQTVTEQNYCSRILK